MEEDTEGLDLLIKHKKKRPNYARVISMEFSKSSSPQSATKRKTSVKQGRSDDGACGCLPSDSDVDSDGSEYFSAEEFLLSTSSSSISSDDESSLGQSSDSVFESLNSSFHSNMSLSETNSDSQSFSTTYETKPFEIKHRAPSKKQKRKRRKISSCHDMQFLGIDWVDMGLNELKLDVIETELSVSKPVPSLVDLCINAARKIPKTITSLNVPKAVKQILHIGNSTHSFRQLQVDYLLNLLEVSSVDKGYHNSNPENKQIFPRRNLWSLDGAYDFYKQGISSSEYLPFVSSVLDESRGNDAFHTCDKIYHFRGRQLSVLAHVMDLLIPGRLTGIKTTRRRHKSDADSCSAEMDNRFKGLKVMLQNRFAHKEQCKTGGLDDNAFEIILPYVCWARGDIRKASQGFLSLAEKEKRVRYKALFLYEAGRMLSQFDDSEAALRYFNLASDAVLSKGKHNKAGVPEQINRQTRLLCAAVQDMGLLNIQKAERSLQLWKSGVSVPCEEIKCAGSLVAIDSFLCFYGAYWHEKTGSVYEEAVKHLTSMATKEGYLYFYLSMMYALMGKGEESSNMYRKFLVSAFQGAAPGITGSSENSARKKTWQPLVDKVKEQRESPTPMKVIWRTQLVPPKCVDPNLKDGHNMPQEADICSRNLNLRISENGFLTGDIQMVLPPIRGVYLDLYTGKLSFPKIPSTTEGWKSYETNIQWYQAHDKEKLTSFFVPTSVELYRGPNGETVEMIHTSIFNVSSDADKEKSFNPHLCQLMWTGPCGQKAKINVYHRAQWFIAEDLQISIKRKCNESEELKAEQIKLISKYINKGWKTTGEGLLTHATNNLQRRKLKGKKDNEKKEKKESKIQKQNLSFFHDIFSVADYCTFGLGLVLAIKAAYNGQGRYLIMIVDCSRKEKFRKPVMFNLGHFSNFVKQTPRMAKGSDVFCVKMTNGGYVTYNVEGEIVNQEISTMIFDPFMDKRFDPVTFSSNIFYLTGDERLCKMYYDCNTNIDFLGEITDMASIADILVMVTKNGAVKFIDIATDLAPLDPILNCSKPLDSSVWRQDELKLKSAVEFSTFKVVGEATFIDDAGTEYTRGAVAIDNHLLIVKIQRNKEDQNEDATVTITLSLTLAGFPKEIHFINETAGFLLTVTQHIKTLHHYRENLYHYDHNGLLKQVLLCLGQGPRSFMTCYLPPDTEREYSDPDFGKAGRRVYMRDGHDGIICALLT